MKTDWFKDWFNTAYYHLLYSDRNHEEAEVFIDKLINYLQPQEKAKFLDIACGKGRHSLQINQLGYQTVGYDLSTESIKHAEEHKNSGMDFYVHDMRTIFRTNYFDFALNLFTSFGYFDTARDEQNAIFSASKSLKKDGVLVIDFLNSKKIKSQLVPSETKTVENITFHITRKIENAQVQKTISFTADNTDHTFTEKVKLLELNDFKQYLTKAGLEISAVFGDYDLSKFQDNSNRLIIIAKKNG